MVVGRIIFPTMYELGLIILPTVILPHNALLTTLVVMISDDDILGRIMTVSEELDFHSKAFCKILI